MTTVTPEPQYGDTARYVFTPTGGEPVTVEAEFLTTWDDELVPCLYATAACDLLSAWWQIDPTHRSYQWPTTENSDDDVFLAFTTPTGDLVLDRWPVAGEHEGYSLTALPGLLPTHHYTLTRAD